MLNIKRTSDFMHSTLWLLKGEPMLVYYTEWNVS